MKFLFVIFFLPLKLLAQDVTGVWTGTLYNDTTKQFLKYELAISEYEGKLSGYSHTIFVIDNIENTGVKSIKIKKSGDEYEVEDDKLIYNNYTEPPAKSVRTFSKLILSENDSSMMLEGPWKTNQTSHYKSITGNISLHKKSQIHETLIIPKLENLGLAKSLSFMPDETFYSKNTAVNTISKNNPSIKSETQNNQTKDVEIENANSANNDVKKKISDTNSNLKSQTKQIASSKTKNNDSVLHKPQQIINNVSSITKPVNEISKVENKSHDSLLTALDQKINSDQTKKVLSISQNETPALYKTEKVSEIIPGKKIIKAEFPVVQNVNKAAAEIATRTIETVKSVDIKNDSLLLTLYDNGEIDGDTVSVLLNGKIIMPMQGLTAKGFSKTVFLTREMGDSIVLIMYAENLGSIPPNTGLLVVHDGNDTYEIRFSGDLQKNAAIVLKRKKKN